jgi:hypothetical protein
MEKIMSDRNVALDKLVTKAIAAIAEPGTEAPPPPETTPRDRFYEFLVLALGTLFPKAPMAGQMYDRATLLRVIEGMDDNESAALAKRADDWLRLEGIIKQMEGQRAYFLPLQTQAALSVNTSGGLLGDVFDKILKRYLEAAPNENLRLCTRLLGAYFLVSYAKV